MHYRRLFVLSFLLSFFSFSDCFFSINFSLTSKAFRSSLCKADYTSITTTVHPINKNFRSKFFGFLKTNESGWHILLMFLWLVLHELEHWSFSSTKLMQHNILIWSKSIHCWTNKQMKIRDEVCILIKYDTIKNFLFF